jgi:hypothetical protein
MTHALLVGLALASSHREAPAIALDPSADLTDFYAFVSPEDSSTVVFILNVNPFSTPGGGPNFHRFDDNVLYQVHVDNEGDGFEDVSFGIRFSTTYDYPEEFLYNLGSINDPANLNMKQTYEVRMFHHNVPNPVGTVIATGTVAPFNVGTQSDGIGGYTPASSTPGTLTTGHIATSGDYRVFAGPRQEGFYVDLERTFDLLNLGNVDNQNTLLGYNVSSIAIEVPAAELTKDGAMPSTLAQNEVIATWATTSRRAERVLRRGRQNTSGDWVQVARLGHPLVNEVVLPISQKDVFNGSHPSKDIQFLGYVNNPILPVYMEALLGIPNPGSFDAGLGIGGREDLILAFLTGHPALNTMPGGYALGGPIPGSPGKVFGAFEALRINLTTASGFPNGRMVGDDVTDVALSAMAGLLIDGTFIPDGVDSTGLAYLNTFPFLGDPWAGDDHPNGGRNQSF